MEIEGWVARVSEGKALPTVAMVAYYKVVALYKVVAFYEV